MRRVVVVGNPGHKRVNFFQDALARRGWPPTEVVSWLDVIAGRLNLFVRSDEQEEAWRWVEPILQYWKNDPAGPRPYPAGSWGPRAASAMIARDGYCWSEEM